MNERHRALLAQAQAKGAELDAILAKGEAITQEDVAKAQGIKSEIEGIKGQLKAQTDLSELQGVSADLKSFLNEPAGMIGMIPAGSTEIKAGVVEQTGAGLLTDAQMKAISTPEYKAAFGRYLRGGEKGLLSSDLKVMQGGVDDQGGFLVPDDILARLIMKKPAPTRLGGFVTPLTTGRDSLVLPKVNYSTDDIYTTGVRATWSGEVPATATAHRVTEPVWGQKRFPVYTAMLSMPLTNNMVEDAMFDVAGFVADKFGETIDLLRDNMILNGTGVGQPSGILANPNATDEPAIVNSGAAAALTADGLINLAYSLPEQYEDNLRWVFNKTNTGKAIAGLKDGEGRYLFSYGMGDNGIASARPKELLGYPFSYSAFMPDVASSAYPVVFGDLSGYYWVSRIGFSIQILRELYAETNQILALGRWRVGGDVAEPWKMKIQYVSA